LLEFRNISKSFADTKANQNISFKVQAGQIHAIIGENGAGKSTLMKILFGIYQADSGTISFRGKQVDIASPVDAKALGIGMVHQHFMLAGPISAVDHILLDEKSKRKLWQSFLTPLSRKQKIIELNQLSKQFNMPVPWHEKIETLPVGLQQRIEILKLLHNHADLLILDEPTAVLTPQETNQLFSQLRSLKEKGKTVLIITHKLREVRAIADQVTVLRQGQVIANLSIQDQTLESLSELMIGRKAEVIKIEAAQLSQKPVVVVNKLSYTSKKKALLHELDLKIHGGEIVGIAGVEGNGQSHLLNAFVRPQFLKGSLQGEILLNGEDVLKMNAYQIRQQGLSFLPEDRLHQGLLVDENGLENFLLGQQRDRPFSKFGLLKLKEIKRAAIAASKKFKVQPERFDLALKYFSGGNQQKFVVGRELYKEPQFLIAAQPTRGVDIGAIEIIHSEIIRQKRRGCAVLLVSSELEELMKLSDRIYVIYNGQFLRELKRHEFYENEIGLLMAGGKL
jgi:general nucleoside transport system ATP-binding protein